MARRTRHAISRRAALASLGAGAGAAAILPLLSDEGLYAYAQVQKSNAPPALRALTRAQYAAVDALTEAIIPADDRSPGARAARVADFIDLYLHEAEAGTRAEWLEGLAALEAEAKARQGAGLAQLKPEQMEALLTEVSRNERDPKTPAERFFRAVKNATIQGYYTSEIGIHKELQYKGN
ncbi:MAG TPA: gluconate 2-dehydrogenase subunit 3 family protein, partial [Vicinamibacterales bacterium]